MHDLLRKLEYIFRGQGTRRGCGGVKSLNQYQCECLTICPSLFTESDQYSDSKDFLAFLKKPKIELLDRYEVDWDRKTDQLDRHEVDWNRNTDRSDRHEVPWDRETDQSVMKRNLGTWAVPNLDNLDHFPNPYANTEVKVKVHFLGLKKVSSRRESSKQVTFAG